MDSPEAAPFPLKYDSITPFQRLMLLRCFRVDRIYRAITEYVTQTMGEKYVMPPVISFESIWEQSTPLSPIVFILSPGSDPATDLMKLAERTDFGSTNSNISLLVRDKKRFVDLDPICWMININFNQYKKHQTVTALCHAVRWRA